MERFNYQSIAAAMAESAELLYLMECASWGYEMDKQEAQREQEAEIARQRMEVNEYE